MEQQPSPLRPEADRAQSLDEFVTTLHQHCPTLTELPAPEPQDVEAARELVARTPRPDDPAVQTPMQARQWLHWLKDMGLPFACVAAAARMSKGTLSQFYNKRAKPSKQLYEKLARLRQNKDRWIHVLAAHLRRKKRAPRAAGGAAKPQGGKKKKVPVAILHSHDRNRLRRDAIDFVRALMAMGIKQRCIAAAIGRKQAAMSLFAAGRCGAGSCLIDEVHALMRDNSRLKSLPGFSFEDLRRSQQLIREGEWEGPRQTRVKYEVETYGSGPEAYASMARNG